MAELSEQQIELISAYIRQKGVAQDELHDDLLDHICTGIENRMQQGDSFEDAFQYNIALFGPGGVQKVQQDTFELLTEINATMKKVTLGFGLTSTILLLAGTSFKLLHWPGAGIMITLGAGFLVLVYFPILLYYKLKESPGKESLMHISGFAGITLTTLGVLFKIMHWPGASAMLLSGMAFLAFLYVPIYFYAKYRSSVNKPITLSTSIVAMTCLILVFALTRVNNSSSTIDGISIVESSLQESAKTGGENALLYDRLRGNPEAAEVRHATQETLEFLSALRANLIAVTEGISVDAASQTELFEMGHFEARKESTALMFSDASDSGFHFKKLTKQLNQFRDAVLEIYPEPLRTELSPFFPVNTSRTYQEDGKEFDWAHYYFDRTPAFTSISVISKLQNDIRHAENQALIYLLSQSAVSNTPG